MLGGGGGKTNIASQAKNKNNEETSQVAQNDLDDEIPF